MARTSPKVAEAREYTVREVCEAAHITPRSLKRWIAAGIVEAPEFRGRATRYTPRQYAQARAAAALFAEGRRTREVARATSRASLATLHELAPLPPPAPPPPASPPPTPTPSSALPAALATMVPLRALELLPGLTLTLRDDATPFVAQVAAEIVARYATRPS